MGHRTKSVSKVKEGKANREVMMFGIVKNGYDSKNLFKGTINPRQKAFLQGGMDDLVNSEIFLKTTCEDFIEDFTNFQCQYYMSKIARLTRIFSFWNDLSMAPSF